MILQKIRSYLPDKIRTEEQDLLIGDTCLALTDNERQEIENLNFENYQYNSPQRAEVSARIARALYKDKLATIRALRVRSTILKTTNPLLRTGLADRLDDVSDLYARENFRQTIVITEIKNSLEYRKWECEKYETIIFPALSRYMDPNQWGKFQLTCPITLDFMLEPVRAIDNHIYDKGAILAHLSSWKKRWNPFLPAERQIDLWMASSPFRNAHITKDTLEPLPDYYKNIFHNLVHNYNSKVLEQQSIVRLAKEHRGPLSKQAKKIVKLYSMTQKKRSLIDSKIGTALLNMDGISNEDLDRSREFLVATAKLPRQLIIAQ